LKLILKGAITAAAAAAATTILDAAAGRTAVTEETCDKTPPEVDHSLSFSWYTQQQQQQ
jgi:hypothetical protein